MNQLDKQIARLRDRGYAWPIPWEAVEMMGRKENCKRNAYLCPANVWTIGWGETEGVTQGLVWSEARCDQEFFEQVGDFTRAVQKQLTRPANPNELGAMVSLAYNIGLGSPADTKYKKGFYWSSVRRLHNAGDSQGASRAFGLFNKAMVDGVLQPLSGLTARRAVEAAMYLTPMPAADGDVFEEPPVQDVAPESPMTASPINRAGIVLVTTGVLQAASETSKEAAAVTSQIAAIAGSLNLSPGLLLAAILLGGGAAVLYWRFKQRQGGWV